MSMTDPSQFEPLFPTLWDPAETYQPKPEGFVDPGVLYPKLPEVTRTYERKYTPNNQFQQRLSSPVYNALLRFDQSRVAQGKAPLSKERTAQLATAAEQNRAVTPAPKPNLAEAAGNDLTTLLATIPKLPFMAWDEVTKFQDIPEKVANIQRSGASPAEQLGQYLQLPGINLIPGSFTASSLLTGNAGQLVEHPLFTALDVLPYASKAAKGTRVAQATELAEQAKAAELSATLREPISPRTPNPLKAVALNRLDDLGNVQRNPLGQTVDAATGLGKRTRLGQLVADTWSPQARQVSRAVSGANKDLRQAFDVEGPATTDPTALWVRDVRSLDTRHPNITTEDRINLTRAVTNPTDDLGNPIDINNMDLTPEQLAYAQELKDLSNRSRLLARYIDAEGNPIDELADREWFGGMETFSKQQASQLDRWDKIEAQYAQRLDTRNRAISNMKRWLNPTEAPTVKQTIGGIDVDGPNPFHTPHLDSAVQQLRQLQRTDPQAKAALMLLKERAFQRFGTKVISMSQKAKYKGLLDPADIDNFRALTSEMESSQRMISRERGVTDRNFASLQQRIQAKKRSIVPARFGEVANAQLKARMQQYVTENFADDPLFQQYLDYVDQGNYSSLVSESDITMRDFYTLQKEVNQTIAGMKEAGVNPVFMHRVTPQSASGINFPAILDKRITPSSLKSRSLDITPYVPDLQVAMTHQGLEFLNRRYADELVQRIDDTWGRDLSELRAEYTEAANKARQANPLLDVNHYIDEAITKDGWVAYDPEKFAPWRKRTGSVQEAQNMRMVPGEIKRNMDRMHKPPKIVAAVDPIMNIFRTSVLALSPRWLVNNVIGGALLLLAETADPIATIRFLGEAKRMTGDVPWLPKKAQPNKGTLHEMRGISEGNVNFTQEEVSRITNATSDADKLKAIYSHSAGRWMKEVWDDTQAQKATGAIRDKFGKVVQKSYDINTWFDDFYRSLAYLTGENQALRKGLSASQAEQQGIAIARKVMQNWDEITPIERTVLRYVFPFYGFMQHIARYVMRYPIDHPWRTAIMGSFARNELEDMGTGLPQRFLSMAFLGGQDEQGMQSAVTLGGANPFAAVSDMYTLGGLLGSTNPLISSFAESLGLDPTTGTAELYPAVRYNPETGRLEPQQENYISTLTKNILPAYNVLNMTVFDKAEFNKLLKTNPDAASRMIQAQLGVPLLYRPVDVPGEIMKAENQRIEAQEKAKSEMLRTGNYEIADQFPGLNSYLARIQELQQRGELEQYQAPEVKVQNPFEAVLQSYLGGGTVFAAQNNTPRYLQKTTLW